MKMEKLLDRLRIRREFEKLKGEIAIVVLKESASPSDDIPFFGKVVEVGEDKASIDTNGLVSCGGRGGIGQIEVISFDKVKEVVPF